MQVTWDVDCNVWVVYFWSSSLNEVNWLCFTICVTTVGHAVGNLLYFSNDGSTRWTIKICIVIIVMTMTKQNFLPTCTILLIPSTVYEKGRSLWVFHQELFDCNYVANIHKWTIVSKGDNALDRYLDQPSTQVLIIEDK